MTANVSNEMHQDVVAPRELEVRFFRLGCGDDVITWAMRLYFEEEGIDGWFFRDPVVVILDLDPDNQKQTCMMMPWLPRGIVASNDCVLEKDEVILVQKVEPDVEEYYKKLCREVFPHKPKITDVNRQKAEGKNVFGFDMNRIRPLKDIKNEKQEKESPKANT